MRLFKNEKKDPLESLSTRQRHFFAMYKANTELFDHPCRFETTVDPANPRTRFGDLALLPLSAAVTCAAIGKTSLYGEWINCARSTVEFCKGHVSGQEVLDDLRLDRVFVPIADVVVELLAEGRLSQVLDVPLVAIERNVRMEKNVVIQEMATLLWVLCSLFNGNADDYASGCARLPSRHSGKFEEERALIGSARCLFHDDCENGFWDAMMKVIDRWTIHDVWAGTDAMGFEEPIEYLLALIWSKYRRPASAGDEFLDIVSGVRPLRR